MTERLSTVRLRIALYEERAERAQLLGDALARAGHEVVTWIGPADDLAARVRNARADALVAGYATPVRADVDVLAALLRDEPLPVVAFADHSDDVLVRAAIKAGVSAFVVDGFAVARVAPILEAARVRFREFQALRLERDDAVIKLAQRKTIERAKGILMRRRCLDEDAAYQVLRRMAMDRGRQLAEVADSIVMAEQALASG